MENLKIKVNNEAESGEVQWLLESLGLRFVDVGEFDYPYWLAVTQKGGTFSNYSGCRNIWYTCSPKELTIPQLRDLVVLKRNSIDDATHVSQSGSKWFVSSDNKIHSYLDKKWVFISDDASDLQDLKPIEKEIKEYLDPRNGYKLIEAPKSEALEPHASEWIEVPKGANVALLEKGRKIEFIDTIKNKVFSSGNWFNLGVFFNLNDYIRKMIFVDVIWQRSETESLNDQYVEIDQVRRKTYGLTPERAARISLKTEEAYLDISDTLKQRESTYGSFEDVACITQDLLSVLKRTGFNSLPKPHKEALHMICSKMARLVNGDFNHVDSWHDIGGYAKLIEDIIKSEKV